jgi:hypothetical protein
MTSVRKLLVLLTLCTLQPIVTNAQFEVGDNVVGLGVGIGGHYNAYSSYSSQTPALGLYYEMGLTDLGPGVLGLGGFVGYKSLAYRSRAMFGPGFDYDWRWTYVIIGVRGAWHYNEWHGIPELDTYGGLMLSYNSVKWTDDTRYPEGYAVSGTYGSSGVGFTAFLGGRYYFTPQLGAQLELGYGISILSLGVVYKF